MRGVWQSARHTPFTSFSNWSCIQTESSVSLRYSICAFWDDLQTCRAKKEHVDLIRCRVYGGHVIWGWFIVLVGFMVLRNIFNW